MPGKLYRKETTNGYFATKMEILVTTVPKAYGSAERGGAVNWARPDHAWIDTSENAFSRADHKRVSD